MAEASIKLKVCGMRDPGNILEIAALRPDYMGFIFYPGSKRFVGKDFSAPAGLPSSIGKVGVFVNESTNEMILAASKHGLEYIQLHGSEEPGQCKALRATGLKIIKAFAIAANFDFARLDPYADVSDYFLFDSAGINFGGSGVPFDWQVLDGYDRDVPFFLSGGLSPGNVAAIAPSASMHAIDVNSGVERAPGVKDTTLLKELIDKFRTRSST